MNIIGAVCCCSRDQGMIAPFVEAWHKAHNIQLVFLNDIESPARIPHGCDVYDLRWPSRGSLANYVMESLANVVIARNLDAIIKLDVDCVHRRIDGKSWLDSYTLDDAAYGIEHVRYPDCFMGASYVLRSDAVCQAAMNGVSCRTRAEDVGVSRAVREAYHDQVSIVPASERVLCGYYPESPIEKYQPYEVIHCGQRQPRTHVAGSMHHFIENL